MGELGRVTRHRSLPGVVCREGDSPFPLGSLMAGAGRLGWGSA